MRIAIALIAALVLADCGAETGGAARFEGGIVRRGRRCVTLHVYAAGKTYRRRVGC